MPQYKPFNRRPPNRMGMSKPTDTSDLLRSPNHLFILGGFLKGKTYREIAADMDKSLGTLRIYVEDLIDLDMLQRQIIKGRRNKILATQKGKDLWNSLNSANRPDNG